MIPLRLVIDTNVLVSAAVKLTGLQRTVLVLATSNPALLYISKPILEEYEEVLSRPELRIRRGLRLQLVQLLKNRSYAVTPVRRIEAAADPDDNKFLECADAARADSLITGNVKHFPKMWKKTRIVSSRDFMTLTAPHIIQ